MSQRYLGETFDIHGGGEDLVFPHHENEIAQSEGATGKPLARFWVHNGFVRVNNEKMSKSLGNFFTVRDILKEVHPEVLRFFFLQSHYRSPIDFSDTALAEARQGVVRFYTAFQRLRALSAAGSASAATLSAREEELEAQLRTLPERFREAMDDDFNTARAIGHLFEMIRWINICLDEREGLLSPALAGQAEDLIGEIGGVLGLFREDPEVYLRLDRDREAAKRGLIPAEIEARLAERRLARESRDWAKADAIRQELAAKGVTLKDTAAATAWAIS